MELLLPEIRPPAPALPSYVKLDMAFGVGAGGQLFDKSRYRSHGAINGPEWAAGLHGYCLDFVPGTLDHVLIPAAYTHLDFTADDFSIIARIKADSLIGNPQLFCRAFASADGYYLRLRDTGRIDFATNQLAASQTTISAVGEIVVANWYTVGMSRVVGAVTLFKNGVDVTAVPDIHENPLTCARSAKIGIYDTLLVAPFDGKIEFLRIFGGVALQPSEHLAWHRALA